MKVMAKVTFAGIDFCVRSGQVADLPETVAEDVIRAGYAEAVEDSKPAKKTAKKKG